MAHYQHTQIGYLILCVTLAVLVFFTWIQIAARTESPSVDSGTNFAMTAIMACILFILASFAALTTSVDANFIRIKFGYGIFRKKFSCADIVSVRAVKNHWYYGWSIRVWFWPYMWIYNVSGFDSVEIIMRNKKMYRIGTDAPNELEDAIRQAINT